MRLRGKVHHRVDPLGLQEVGDEVPRADVAFDEFEVRFVGDGAQVAERGAVVELVEGDDADVRVAADEEGDDVGGDEAGAALLMRVMFFNFCFFLFSS